MAARQQLSIDLDAEVAAILRAHAAETQLSEGEIVDRAIRASTSARSSRRSASALTSTKTKPSRLRARNSKRPATSATQPPDAARRRRREPPHLHRTGPLPNTPSVQTLDAALDGRLELITSLLLLRELANVLVTGDDDLLAIDPDQLDIEILRPRQLVDRLD
jgi:hypothetical protein